MLIELCSLPDRLFWCSIFGSQIEGDCCGFLLFPLSSCLFPQVRVSSFPVPFHLFPLLAPFLLNFYLAVLAFREFSLIGTREVSAVAVSVSDSNGKVFRCSSTCLTSSLMCCANLFSNIWLRISCRVPSCFESSTLSYLQKCCYLFAGGKCASSLKCGHIALTTSMIIQTRSNDAQQLLSEIERMAPTEETDAVGADRCAPYKKISSKLKQKIFKRTSRNSLQLLIDNERKQLDNFGDQEAYGTPEKSLAFDYSTPRVNWWCLECFLFGGGSSFVPWALDKK